MSVVMIVCWFNFLLRNHFSCNAIDLKLPFCQKKVIGNCPKVEDHLKIAFTSTLSYDWIIWIETGFHFPFWTKIQAEITHLSFISLSFFLKPDILVYSKYIAIFSVAQYHFLLLYINGDFSETQRKEKKCE